MSSILRPHATARPSLRWWLVPAFALPLVLGMSPALADEPVEPDEAVESDGSAESDGVGESDATVEQDAPEEALPTSFADTANRGHNDAVLGLAEEGIIQGCEEELFCPDKALTRAQWATMLSNALELEPLTIGPFTDIDGNVHEQRINALAEEGITLGCAADRYCPDQLVSREQAATLIVRAFDIPETVNHHFDDLTATHGDNVNRLGEVGIAAGCSDPLNHFCSAGEVLRWEAATFLARTLNLVDRVELEPLTERRERQERIDAEREAQRQAELEEQRRAEEEARRAAEEAAAAADPWGISSLSDARIRMWERLAQCESNGNERAVSANGLYYGWLQFHPRTWRSVGGTGLPNEATWQEHIYRAERLLEQPWATLSNQWPACSRMLGIG